MGHYKTPRTESQTSIKEYITDHHSAYDRLFVVGNLKGLLELESFGVSSVPTVQIFDKRKNLLTMASESGCDWALANFFKDQSRDMVVKDSVTYPFVMARLLTVDLKTDQDTFDYYIITYWAKFLPKLTQRLFEQTNMMKDSMQENVCFISVSLDEQEIWEHQ